MSLRSSTFTAVQTGCSLAARGPRGDPGEAGRERSVRAFMALAALLAGGLGVHGS
jgi:hypothetical protein